MRRSMQRFAVCAAVLLAASAPGAVAYKSFNELLPGYMAWEFCNGLFVSHLPYSTVWNNEGCVANCYTHSLFDGSNGGGHITISNATRAVNASLGGISVHARSTGPELGCQLQLGNQTLNASLTPVARESLQLVADEWPEATQGSGREVPGIDYSALNAAVGRFFDDAGLRASLGTRAVIIIYKGKVVAERYAGDAGVTRDSRLLGWSMTKSVTSALVGARVQDGAVAVSDVISAPGWSAAEAARRGITLGHLLRMQSGLDFPEDYILTGDVGEMLFAAPDAAAFVGAHAQKHAPGTMYEYMTANYVLAQWHLRRSFKGNDAAYWGYAQQRLFAKIGARSFLVEADPAGTLLGGSSAFATARDWARFGQLFLQDGVWKGERLLPEGWVDYSVQDTALGPEYGAGWWDSPSLLGSSGGAREAFSAVGIGGQVLDVLPSHGLVAVHLGTGTGTMSDTGAVHGVLFPALLSALPSPGSAAFDKADAATLG